MACALSNTARLLKYCSRNVMKVNLRFCSSSESKYGKSNASFTSFTTKTSGFQDFEKTPSLKVIASIIINGASIPPNSHLFSEKIDATELIEGSLHAVEAVTQAISSETEDADGVVSDLLTNNCISSMEHILLEQIGIDKEDIFFAWLGKFDDSKTQMTICTLSFPSYHYLRQTIPGKKAKIEDFVKEQAEATKDGRLTKDHMEALDHHTKQELINRDEFNQHMNSNDIIVSNWEFVQEDGDWKIDNIAMRKLKECIMKPFYIRWQFRIKFAIATNADFTRRVLRYDYGTDYLFMLILLNFAILSSVMIPN